MVNLVSDITGRWTVTPAPYKRLCIAAHQLKLHTKLPFLLDFLCSAFILNLSTSRSYIHRMKYSAIVFAALVLFAAGISAQDDGEFTPICD